MGGYSVLVTPFYSALCKNWLTGFCQRILFWKQRLQFHLSISLKLTYFKIKTTSFHFQSWRYVLSVAEWFEVSFVEESSLNLTDAAFKIMYNNFDCINFVWDWMNLNSAVALRAKTLASFQRYKQVTVVMWNWDPYGKRNTSEKTDYFDYYWENSQSIDWFHFIGITNFFTERYLRVT